MVGRRRAVTRLRALRVRSRSVLGVNGGLAVALMVVPGLMLVTTAFPLTGTGLNRGVAADTLPFSRGLGAGQGIAPLRSGYVEDLLGGFARSSAHARPPVVDGAVAQPAAPQGGHEVVLTSGTVIHPLANDAFARAYPIEGLPFSGLTTTTGGTREPGEPELCGDAGTVWFSYVAASGRSLLVSTYGSDYDAQVAVFTGDALQGLEATSGCIQRLANQEVREGTRYLFQVTGTGRLAFHLVTAPGLGTLTLESRSRSGRPAAFLSDNAAISADGRIAAFVSGDHSLANEDPTANGATIAAERCARVPFEPTRDNVRPCSTGIYERDRRSGRVVAVYGGYDMRSSDDAGVLAFRVGRPNLPETVMVWSRATSRVTVAPRRPDGTASPAKAAYPMLSADGRYLIYESDATDIVPVSGEHNNVFVLDRATGRTDIVRSPSGAEPDGAVHPACLSADGRYAVVSTSAALDPRDANDVDDYYRIDLRTRAAIRVSVGIGGTDGNGPSSVLQWHSGQCLSHDGRFVLFNSAASNLVPNDRNGTEDVFVRDVLAGVTERVNVASSGAEANASSGANSHFVNTPVGDVCPAVVTQSRCYGFTQRQFGDAISPDGRFVAFGSGATNLAERGDANGVSDIFRHDRLTGQTILVSHGPDGAAAVGGESYGAPVFTADGNAIAFVSKAGNLTGDGQQNVPQVYLWRTP